MDIKTALVRFTFPGRTRVVWFKLRRSFSNPLPGQTDDEGVSIPDELPWYQTDTHYNIKVLIGVLGWKASHP